MSAYLSLSYEENVLVLDGKSEAGVPTTAMFVQKKDMELL